MDSPAAAAPAKPHGHSIGFNLAVIALSVAVGALGVAYLIDGAERLARKPRVSDDAVVTRTLGSTTLTIPASWLPDGVATTGDFAKQIDLALSLPLGPDGALRPIDVTLTQRSRVRPSAALLDGVYLHQFGDKQVSGPVGLVGKPMTAGDGYDGETVWYDPLTPNPFVAKCEAPVAATTTGKCLRTVYLGSGIAAVYSFDTDVLESWRRFDAELHPLLDRIGAL